MSNDGLQLSYMVPSAKPKTLMISLEDLPQNEDLDLPKGHPTAEFVQDIMQRGQLEPISVLPLDANGDAPKYAVMAGNKRVAAFRRIAEASDEPRWKKIWAVVRDVDDDTGLGISTASNHQRTGNIITDLKAILNFQKKYPNTSDKITAHVLGMRLSTFRKTKKLLNLQPVFLAAVLEGQLATGVAYEIAKQSDEIQDNLWNIYSDKGSISSADVVDAQRVRREQTIEEQKNLIFPDFVVPTTTTKLVGYIVFNDQLEVLSPIVGTKKEIKKIMKDMATLDGVVDMTEGKVYVEVEENQS